MKKACAADGFGKRFFAVSLFHCRFSPLQWLRFHDILYQLTDSLREGIFVNIGVILAAGHGSRMGTALPKQFLPLHGAPILVHSVRRFAECRAVDKLLIALPPEYLAYGRDLLAQYFPGNSFFLTAGGADRSATLRLLVDFVFESMGADETTILITHDGVRPYVSEQMILDNIRAARECGACNTVVPAVDTILVSLDGTYISSVPDRATLYHAQTPQSFSAVKLKRLLDRMSDEELSRLTDGCSVFVVNGEPVKLVPGSRENIKITVPSDLDPS